MFLTLTKKSPFYQLIYEVDGFRTTISTRTKDKSKAEIFMTNFKPEELKPKEIIPKIYSIKLNKFKKEYLEYISSTKSKSYIRSVNLSFNQFQSYSKDIPLIRINNKLIDKFILKVFSRSKYAASLYYKTLKAAFTKAVDWNYLEFNPFKKVKLPKIATRKPLFMSDEEFQQLINNTHRQFLKNIFYTAYYTGMRLGEILNMKWNWINFKDNIITVKCTEEFLTKSKRERIIPINKVLRFILLNQLPRVIDINQNDFVFTKVKGVKLNENFVSKQFKKSVRAADLNDDIHFHCCRHSFASHLVQKSVSLYVVKELLGHEDLKTTQIYSHLQPENLMQAVNLL